MTGSELIAQERQRQIDGEGWTPEHDDEHRCGELAMAAACYALPDGLRKRGTIILDRITREYRYATPQAMPDFWPWAAWWWKSMPGDRIRELVKAGALIAAEIDRLQRQRERER